MTFHPSSCMCMAVWCECLTSLLPEVLDALLLPYCPGSQLLSCWKGTIKFSTTIRAHLFKKTRRSWRQKKAYHHTSSLQISSLSLRSLCTRFLEVFIVATDNYSFIPLKAKGSTLSFILRLLLKVSCLRASSMFSSCCVPLLSTLPFFSHLWHCLPPVSCCYQK